MKNFLTLIVLQLVAFGLFGQVGLGEIYLGTKGAPNKIVTETMGGVTGVILADTINDGRICTLMFIPSSKGGQPTGIYQSTLDQFLSALESKFKTKFGFYLKSEDKDDDCYISRFATDGREYSIIVTINVSENSEPPIEALLYLMDEALVTINSDF